MLKSNGVQKTTYSGGNMTNEPTEDKPKHKMTYAERWLAKKTPKPGGFYSKTSYNKHINGSRKKQSSNSEGEDG